MVPGSLTSDASRTPLIMIIEDEPDSAALLEDVLQEAKFRTAWHRNGAEALRALDTQAEIPDLIMLDLRMPVMDGWTFRVEQRKRPRLQGVPVAAMSADGSPQAEAIDADFFLQKPLNFQRLLPVVEEALLTQERRKLMTKSIELERLRSLGMLLGSVAHELSGPLQYVSGFLSLATRQCEALGKPAAPILHSIQSAQTATEGMREIAKDLRTFSRVESSDCTADVTAALDAALRLCEPTLRMKATLEKHYEGNLPRVIGNEARLGQVFLNILTNAAQAIQSGTRRDNLVRVKASRERERVVVEIRDTGTGMPPEVLARVFEAFFTTKPPEEGTGLGLSFSKDIIESYGGKISASSEPHHGTTFRVELVPVADRRPK